MDATLGSLFSIGHSNHSIERFLDLVAQNDIQIVADVRSSPYSKYSPWFNKDDLNNALETQGVRYVFLGQELGGRPADEHLYDDQGYALYDRFLEMDYVQRGLARLMSLIEEGHRVAVLCSEEDPRECHRHRLIAWEMDRSFGIVALHIRGDGSVESELDLRREDQPGLFDADEEMNMPPRSAKRIQTK